MKAKLLAIAAVALLLQTAAQAGPYRSIYATSTQTIEIPKGQAVTITNFVHSGTSTFTQLSVQFDSEAPMPVLVATQTGNAEAQKDFVIAAKSADGKQRVLKLIIGVFANDVAFLTYKLSAN